MWAYATSWDGPQSYLAYTCKSEIPTMKQIGNWESRKDLYAGTIVKSLSPFLRKSWHVWTLHSNYRDLPATLLAFCSPLSSIHSSVMQSPNNLIFHPFICSMLNKQAIKKRNGFGALPGWNTFVTVILNCQNCAFSTDITHRTLVLQKN